MEPLISVIVPIYKVEKYLDKCINSIVDQTYNNLEIILVDDGSPDRCPAMCDDWAKKDSRIKVIHKENGGVSSARNTGIDTATGEFIAFVDGDDIIDKDMYAVLLDNALRENADITMCSFKYFNYEKQSFCEGTAYYAERKILLPDEACADFFKTCNGHLVSLCNKIIKKHIFDGLYFPVGRVFEDWTLAPMLYYRANKICYIPQKFYTYIVHESSIVRTVTIKRYYDCVCADYDHYRFFKEMGISDFNPDIQFLIWNDFKKMCKIYSPSKENREYIKKAYKICASVSSSTSGKIMYYFRIIISILYKLRGKKLG